MIKLQSLCSVENVLNRYFQWNFLNIIYGITYKYEDVSITEVR